MEHIIQIAVGIDDDAIHKIVVEKAAKTIIQDIEKDVRNKLFERYYYQKDATVDNPLSAFTKNLLVEFLEKNKDVIVEKASSTLADKLSRTKIAKEYLTEALKGE